MSETDEFTPHEAIMTASELVADGAALSSNYRYRALVDRLAEHIIEDQSPRESLSSLIEKLDQIIREAETSEDVTGTFYRLLSEHFDTTAVSTYHIGFPLRTRIDLPNDITVDRIELSQSSRRAWRDMLPERGSDDREAFEEFKTRLHDSGVFSAGENTFWHLRLDARDPVFVLEEFETRLNCLLGQFNYGFLLGRPIPLESREFGRPRRFRGGLHVLRYPPCILMESEGEYLGYHPYPDRYTRYEIQSHGETGVGSHVREISAAIGDAPRDSRTGSDELTSAKEAIATAFRVYQLAVTAEGSAQRFLNWWQALETLTLTDDESSSRRSLERARTFPPVAETHLSGSEISRLADLRNRLVHRGQPSVVLSSDQNHLKQSFEAVVAGIVPLVGEYSLAELQTLLDYGSKATGQIEQAIEEHERTIVNSQDEITEAREQQDRLRTVLDWLED